MAGKHEPVAYLYSREDGSKDLVLDCNGDYARNLIELGCNETPLYAHPPCEGIPNPSAISEVVEALRWYGHQFCEFGASHECCGRMTDDDCSGCKARIALAKLEGRSND